MLPPLLLGYEHRSHLQVWCLKSWTRPVSQLLLMVGAFRRFRKQLMDGQHKPRQHLSTVQGVVGSKDLAPVRGSIHVDFLEDGVDIPDQPHTGGKVLLEFLF